MDKFKYLTDDDLNALAKSAIANADMCALNAIRCLQMSRKREQETPKEE